MTPLRTKAQEERLRSQSNQFAHFANALLADGSSQTGETLCTSMKDGKVGLSILAALGCKEARHRSRGADSHQRYKSIDDVNLFLQLVRTFGNVSSALVVSADVLYGADASQVHRRATVTMLDALRIRFSSGTRANSSSIGVHVRLIALALTLFYALVYVWAHATL
jgi:hypothetical protein